MTKEIEDLNERFGKLKEAAKKHTGLPEGFESQIDIRYFNDLCLLYYNYSKGIHSKSETMNEGGLMRTNYINAVRESRREKLKITRDCRDYGIAELAFSKLNKECLKMTVREREPLYLDILSVVNPVATKLIKKQLNETDRNQDNSSDEKPEQKGKTVARLILKNKTVHSVCESDVKHYKELYPAVDVLSELRKMQGWCENNPSRRKTAKGIGKFINNWLATQQDSQPNSQENKNNARTYDLDAFMQKSLNLKYVKSSADDNAID